jgi:serine acetyltransferase
MDGIQLFDKLNLKAARLFTIFSRRAFGSFGRGSLLYFPNYFTNPARMFIGTNVKIMPGCWVMTISEWKGSRYDGQLYIGNNSILTFDVQISACSSIRIGEKVVVSRGAVIVDHLHDYRVPEKANVYGPITDGKPITIEDNVFLGAHCTIAPGVHIGRNTFIGANSTVVDDLPANCLAAGSPAKVIRRYDPQT